ncbi:glycerophosphodiester phosphodiesterase [Streptomyces sp. CMB-StM0423]|uniref:glycerophosphodiester phosphodiesterase n=1 Tax=Streptomyces sp. CMB-StM0423 TaxID=2059884 RepID=UPI000C707B68|nr:glycerophosphodiester phosphodiesterase family protein [Streptomyces sp. CMB-StM0423]AUH39307.1 hydrolase [Streptomyces sp. CMB-StM0423]
MKLVRSLLRAAPVLAALTAAGILAGASAAQAAPAGPDVIAHRGSSGVAPENTAAATRLAVRQDADFVEIDVQRTKDGKLVNFHDCTMERTTDIEEVYPGRPSYRVSDFTWAELSRLDAGSWFSARYAGEPVITVDRVIDLVDRKSGLLAEISPCGHYDAGLPADLAELLQAKPRYVQRALANGQLAVQSFELDDAQGFKNLMPEVPIGFLDADRPTEAELIALSEWADQVNPQYTVTDQALVDRVHELGMDINVWTVDEPGAMRRMAGLGVDGIITDYPQSLT